MTTLEKRNKVKKLKEDLVELTKMLANDFPTEDGDLEHTLETVAYTFEEIENLYRFMESCGTDGNKDN